MYVSLSCKGTPRNSSGKGERATGKKLHKKERPAPCHIPYVQPPSHAAHFRGATQRCAQTDGVETPTSRRLPPGTRSQQPVVCTRTRAPVARPAGVRTTPARPSPVFHVHLAFPRCQLDAELIGGQLGVQALQFILLPSLARSPLRFSVSPLQIHSHQSQASELALPYIANWQFTPPARIGSCVLAAWYPARRIKFEGGNNR